MVAAEFIRNSSNSPHLYRVENNLHREPKIIVPNRESLMSPYNRISVEAYNPERDDPFVGEVMNMWYPGKDNEEQQRYIKLIQDSAYEGSESSFDVFFWQAPNNFEPHPSIESKLFIPETFSTDRLLPVAFIGYTEGNAIKPEVRNQVEQYLDDPQNTHLRQLRAYYNHYWHMYEVERYEGLWNKREERISFIDELSRQMFNKSLERTLDAPAPDGKDTRALLCSSDRYPGARDKIYLKSNFSIVGDTLNIDGIDLYTFLHSGDVYSTYSKGQNT